jgi:hypothetical protein
MGDGTESRTQISIEYTELEGVTPIKLSGDQIHDIIHIAHQMRSVIGSDAYRTDSFVSGKVRVTDKLLMIELVSRSCTWQFFGEKDVTTGIWGCHFCKISPEEGYERQIQSVPECSSDMFTIHSYIVRGGFQPLESLGITVDLKSFRKVLTDGIKASYISEAILTSVDQIRYLRLEDGGIALVIRNESGRGVCYIDGPYRLDDNYYFLTESIAENGIWFIRSYYDYDSDEDTFNFLNDLFIQILIAENLANPSIPYVVITEGDIISRLMKSCTVIGRMLEEAGVTRIDALHIRSEGNTTYLAFYDTRSTETTSVIFLRIGNSLLMYRLNVPVQYFNPIQRIEIFRDIFLLLQNYNDREALRAYVEGWTFR